MDEYISREEVVRYLKGYSEKELNKGGNFGMITSSVLDKAERAISEMPSADVKPVKHGQFEEYSEKEKYEVYKKYHRDFDGLCSECGSHMFRDDKFCADCGARMDGDIE